MIIIENRYIRTITIAVALVFILALVGSASAGNAVQLKIKGNGKLVDGAKIFESDNDAVAERTLQVTLNGPGKLAFFDAGTVHAENTDRSIVADVNVSKIQVSGKASGTGTVIANATVRAEGHNFLDGQGAVFGINASSEIISFVDLNAGAKGTAEGTAFASGSATATGATPAGSSVDTSATGTASASGKVTSTNPSQLHAEGRISGTAGGVSDDGIIDPQSVISAEVFGHDASQGAASASGEASAIGTNIDGVTVDTSVEGATSAGGSSAKGGMFSAMSKTIAFGWYFPGLMNVTESAVWATTFTEGLTNTGKGSAIASASGDAESDISGIDPASFHAEIENATVAASSSTAGDGHTIANSYVNARASDLDFFFMMNTPLDDPAAIGFDIHGDAVDTSYITSKAGAFGDNPGFKGSAASASTAGEVESAVALDDVNFTNTFATGATAASAAAAKTADAAAGSAIISVNVINSTDSQFILLHPDEGTNQLSPAYVAELIDLPDSSLADTSIIADYAYANGESKTDTAKACSSASGETGAIGSLGESEIIVEAFADSFASGTVKAAASVGAKADPFAASIIASTSIPGLGDDSLVDASLIAGIAESAGPKGAASASASGTTSANGSLGIDLVTESALLESHTAAMGMTTAAASSTDGFALSFANIGSANYENFVPDNSAPWNVELVDVSLIGGVSTADGKASTSSTAAGFTTSDGKFIDEDATGVELENITAHTDAMSGEDTVATSVTSFGGFGLATAGVGSVSVVNWKTGTFDANPPPAATVVDVSLIGDLVVADGFGPKDTATAVASANGVTGATGNVLDTFTEDLVFNVTGDSFATGEVSGKAVGNAISDPISVSAILSVNVVDVENTVDTGLGIPSDSTLVDVSTITSASLASGKNGVAQGSAEGFTGAGGAVSAVDILDNVTLISGTFAEGEAMTSAATTADSSLAISLAGQTAVDVIVNNEEPVVNGGGSILSDTGIASFVISGVPVEMPPEANMLIGNGNDELDRLACAVKESGLLETDQKVGDEIGPFLQLLCDNREAMPSFAATENTAGDPVVVGVSAAGSAVFSSGKGTASAETDGAAGSEGFVYRLYGLNVNPEIESETFTGADSNADVRTFGGFGIGAAGAASVDVVTFEPDFFGGVPTANIVDVSVIGDAVFAQGMTPKDTAKVTASADAFTEASGSVETFVLGGIIPGIAIPVANNNASSETSAEGKVFGSAEAAHVSDPISALLIASVSVVDMNPLVIGEDESVFDASLITSASFAADDYGKASGSASGITDASNDLAFEDIDLGVTETLASDTDASGSAATDVSVKDGFGVGITAIGSVNEANYDVYISADVDDTSFMFTYAAGQGNQVKSSAAATDALTTSTGSYDAVVTATDEELVDMDSETGLNGSGSSNVQVAGGHQAEALSFMFADQEDFADAFGQTANAIAAFGVELDGCDNSPVTSTASLSDGHLLADADSDNLGESGAFVEFTGIDAFAQLKPAQNIATIEVADSVPDLSYAPAGGADVDTYILVADTNSQPNTVTYTRFGEAVSDENNLFVPDLQVLPILPFF